MKGEKKTKTGVWGYILKYGLPMCISIGLCYILFHDLDFGEMVAFVRRDCDFSLIALSMCVGFLTFMIRALRWRIQLRAAGIAAGVAPMTASIIGTYAVNLVFPRLGEFWRAEFISRRRKSPFGTVFGSVVAERASDTLVVLLLFAATFFMAKEHIVSYLRHSNGSDSLMAQLISSPWTYIGGIALAGIVALLMHRFRNNSIVKKIGAIWRDLVSGFCTIFHMKGSGRWLLLTLLLWSAYFIQLLICFEAFSTTRALVAQHGLILVLVCYVLSSIAMGVPSNGGIGPYQFALVFGMQCFVPDIDTQQAYSFANVVLGASTLLTIVCGIITFITISIANHRS